MPRQPLILAALLACLLAGCSGVSNLPRLANPLPSLNPPPDTRSLPIPASGQVSVAPGDTVYAVARRYGVSMRDVIEENDLRPPYLLQVGQILRLPPPRTYSVRPGDTVFEISRRFDVDMRTLVSMNDIQPPYQLKPGQSLKMPVRDRPDPPGTSARSGGGTTASAMPLPLPRPERAARPSSAAPPRVSRPVPAVVATPPPRSDGRFLWPVRGRVISNFGPRAGGLHNDGINIAAPKGAPILAAENGVVAYAGDGLKGFGNLLLLKHADGWTTAYAHADRLLVKRGDVVKRGQTIATVGSSGGVTRPQLHFEVRRGARAVNPKNELGA